MDQRKLHQKHKLTYFLKMDDYLNLPEEIEGSEMLTPRAMKNYAPENIDEETNIEIILGERHANSEE